MSAFPNETAFIKGQLSTLASLLVTYSDDHQPPLEQYSRRIGVLPVDLPPPPERKAEASDSVVDTVSITFKSAKPPISFPLTVSTADTIGRIKQQLSAQPRAPPADVQRLLLKGKALADAKLLKEYGVTNGATINLMIKPGALWNGTESLSPITVDTSATESPGPPPDNGAGVIPSLVISPLPPSSGSPLPRPAPIPLELDTTFPQVQESAPEASTFHTTISSPGFWDRMHLFLRTEFTNKDDAGAAFEQFLIASKGSLTVGEIAKIRDQVGVVGMAGT